MRQLVLLRHAKAAANSDTGEDFDRPLAARGREDAPVVGKALARCGGGSAGGAGVGRRAHAGDVGAGRAAFPEGGGAIS